MIGVLLDAVLAGMLLWLAWRCLASADLFKAVVLFIAFGLVLAVVWVRLEAPDVALAEAAIGSGLTGALLLTALRRIHSAAKGRTIAAESGRGIRALAVLAAVTLFGLLVWAVVSLAPVVQGLAQPVQERSSIANPVTAVLLDFRGYDTLLEIAVLLLALMGASALPMARRGPVIQMPGPVLLSFARVMVPVMVVVAGYFLWAGASMPGGAFQAAAVLAGAGLLARLSGLARSPDLDAPGWRAAVVFGFALFLAVAVAMLVLEGRLLQYPRALSATLILLIEAGLAISLGFMLLAFFAEGGSRDK